MTAAQGPAPRRAGLWIARDRLAYLMAGGLGQVRQVNLLKADSEDAGALGAGCQHLLVPNLGVLRRRNRPGKRAVSRPVPPACLILARRRPGLAAR